MPAPKEPAFGAIITFKLPAGASTVGTPTPDPNQLLKLTNALKANGFAVSTHGQLAIKIFGRKAAIKRVFGVSLTGITSVTPGGGKTLQIENSDTGEQVRKLSLPDDFPGQVCVGVIVLMTQFVKRDDGSIPSSGATASLPPASGRAHDPDVPGDLAYRDWFVYPYETRSRLCQDGQSGGGAVTSSAIPNSSPATIINIVDDGVDITHPYFQSRWGKDVGKGIQASKQDLSTLIRELSVPQNLVNDLTVYATAVRDRIADNSKPMPMGLMSGKPLYNSVSLLKGSYTELDTTVEELFSAEAAYYQISLQNPAASKQAHLDGLDAVANNTEHLTKFISAVLADPENRRLRHQTDADSTGHGTSMVVAAKSIAPEARIHSWQQAGAAAVGWPVKRAERIKLGRNALLKQATNTGLTAVPKNTTRPRQILSCSWGESVNTKVAGHYKDVSDSALRMLASATVREAISQGYVVVLAAGNVDNPKSPKINCYAELGTDDAIVVGGGWWDGGNQPTLSDAAHGFVDLPHSDDTTNRYPLKEPVPNVLGLCGPTMMNLGGEDVEAAPYCILPGSQNMAEDAAHIELKDSSGKSLGVWRRYNGGTSAACAQVAGATALLLEVNRELSAKQIKDFLVLGATPCVAGESYQKTRYDQLRQTNNGPLVGIINIARSIELIREAEQKGTLKSNIAATAVPIQ